ncbi:hypothetical protein CDES_12375 [Corynebacterium deserti GIMN1.010]|uniref:Chemotaxis methyl-accepting receptor HlyB-like 4HB MCP domain-containing protein n=1 Tax=Corynebacterium deserti GIMN1.010 TaxID=931089 RepID=A0A0M3QA75_9CORY|nr:hypothetical protein [Corynebacterium deserti]ALC06823.1 hypothetical protein CDES_12375 [Corynebacterium deserti GIMN1.010]
MIREGNGEHTNVPDPMGNSGPKGAPDDAEQKPQSATSASANASAKTSTAPSLKPKRIKKSYGPSDPALAALDSLDEEDSPDHWLDPLTDENASRRSLINSIVQETFGQPIFVARRIWSFINTSPGKMTLMTVIISVAIAAAGYAMSVSSDNRQANLDELITNAEPISYNAHVLYTSLSVADTTATTGFVQAGVEGPVNRVKYHTAIERAAVAATHTATSADTSDEKLMELVLEIQRQLPVYTGLVETARANNRAGNPVSVAYMSEASSMMRNDILPKASELYNMTSRNVSDQQRAVTRPQWIPLSGLVAALGMLIIGQWWLMRVTRRRINKGFALATILMLTATMWVSAANWATWQAGTRGFEEASGPLNSMTTARIYAQQTRTTETLSLVRRQSIQGSGTGFAATINQIKRALDEYETTTNSQSPEHQAIITDIRNAMANWTAEHEQFTVLLERGDYNGAVNAVLSSDDNDQTSFDVLDTALAELIADSRSSMRSYIQSGLQATSLVSVTVMILSLAAVLAVWIGIRPRLQEYL